MQYGDDLGSAMDASGTGAGLALALAGVLGNARAAVRERGMGAANALMGALGPHALAGPVFAEPTLLHARNWRLREGVLRLYAAQVLAFGEGAAPAGDALTHAAASALTEAAPEMRRAAADALACLALSFAWSAAAAASGRRGGVSSSSSAAAAPGERERAAGLTRVLSILGQATDKGLPLRAVHMTAVRERHAALAAAMDGGGSGAAAGSHDDDGARHEDDDAGHDGATGVAARRGVSASTGAGASAGGAGRGAAAAGAASLGDTQRSTASAASAGSGGSGGGGGSRPATGTLRLKVPGPDGSAPPSLASSSGFSAASGGGSRAPTPSAASSASGGAFAGAGIVYAPTWDEAASDAAVNSLCELHASPLWRCGVVGFPPAEVGAVRPVAVTSGKELAKVMDGILSVCATTTSDWNERSKALDRLRGLVAGGPANPTPSVDGFAGQVARARDALCTQVQELRSSLAKQACLAVAELSATLGGVVAAASGAPGMSGSSGSVPPPSPAAAAAAAAALDSLIEPLVEVLTRLTSVSIAVISSSADAAVRSLLHNARAGCHRALPKLTAVCRGKSSTTRAHAAFYLLQALRGWPRACLERHADELAGTVLALLRDADPNARAAARHAAWSLCAALPGRRDSLLSSLDARTQRSLVAEEARTAALEAAAEHVCTPVVTLPPICMAAASDGASPVGYSAGSSSGSGSGFYGGMGGAGSAGGFGPGAAASRPASALAPAAAAGPGTGTGRSAAAGSSAGGGGSGGLPPSGAGMGYGHGHGSAYGSAPSSTAGSPTGAGHGHGNGSASSSGRPLSAPVLAAAGSAATYGAGPAGAATAATTAAHRTASAAPAPSGSGMSAAAVAAGTGAGMGIAAGGVRGAVGAAHTHTSAASAASAASSAATGTTIGSAGDTYGAYGAHAGYRSGSAAPTMPASGPCGPAAASHHHDEDFDDGGFVPPQLLSSPTPAGIGALVSRALTLAQAGSTAAAAAYAASGAGTGHGHPLRVALADLHASLVACRAIDARSAARAYADRLPSAAAGGLRAVIPAPVREEFGRANPGTQPLICDGYLAAPAALAFASQLLAPVDSAAGTGAGSSGGGTVRLPASPSPLLRLLLACLRHPHELVQLDGLALAFATLDACADVGGALSDALTDIMLPWGAPSGSGTASGAAASAAAAAAFGPEALALALDHGAAVVRLFTVKVQSASHAAGHTAGAPTPTTSRLVSVAPVYARLMLLQTAGPLAGIDPAGGAASASAAAAASSPAGTSSGGSGPVVPLPPPFLDLLQWVIALSAVGGSDALRAAARRVIAALRRAFPLPVLLPAVVACMSRPLTGAGAAGSSGAASAASAGGAGGAGSAAGGDGAAEAASARTSRTHAACLMLTLSLLGDAGGATWLLAPSHAAALARLLSRAAAIAMSPTPAPTHLAAAGAGGSDATGAGASAPHPDMTQYAEGALRLLAGSDPARVGAAVATLRPEERSLWTRLASAAGIPLPIPAPAPAAPAAAVPVTGAVSMRPPPAVPTASSAYSSAAAAGAAASATPAAVAAAGGAVANSGPLAFPMSRPSLELVREALASGEHERVTRALHYLGRQVDVIPAAAATASAAGAAATASGADAAGGAPMLPLALPPVPAAHADDAAFLSLVERTGAAVLAVAEAAAGLRPLASVAAGGPAGLSLPGRPSSAASAAAVDPSLLSTSLSVLRKLFRNAAAYMLPCLGGALTSLLACAAAVSREELVVVERTLEEAAERMPAAATLSHLVAAACTVHIPPPLPPASATPAAGDAGAASAAAAANAAGGVAVACFRALARLAPRMPAHLLLDECARGRLMAAVQAGFGSGASDVRRAVLTLLVALTLHLRSAFARYADAYLTPAQSKLVAVYVDKALAAQAAAAHVAGAR